MTCLISGLLAMVLSFSNLVCFFLFLFFVHSAEILGLLVAMLENNVFFL